MGLTMIMMLVLPLFPAQPLLGPIYVQVGTFMPPDFPLLLVVPALASTRSCAVRVTGSAATGRWRRSSPSSFVAASSPCSGRSPTS